MCCAIWYHLCNFKNLKNAHGRAFNTSPWVSSRFLNCTNGTKSCKASHMNFVFLNIKIYQAQSGSVDVMSSTGNTVKRKAKKFLIL